MLHVVCLGTLSQYFFRRFKLVLWPGKYPYRTVIKLLLTLTREKLGAMNFQQSYVNWHFSITLPTKVKCSVCQLFFCSSLAVFT